jgi:DNA-binding NarL/FixJ family response regulator
VSGSVGDARGDQAAAERGEIVDRIGPQARGLLWADGQLVSTLDVPRASGNQSVPLTQREQQVAALVARGLTNRQIADALVIAEGTAGIHVDHILNKLGFHSRTEVAVWAGQHDLQLRDNRKSASMGRSREQ